MADWDVVIIGGGAAGLSAAAAAGEAGLSCLVIDRMGGGGELMNLGALEDVGEEITGPDLFARLLEAATNAGAEPGIAEVTGLVHDGVGWGVMTDEETYRAQAVILAVGLAPGTLGLPNEAAFEGMGLSHCAACDGPLFRGQNVVVAGAGRWAVAEAVELRDAGCAVTLVTQGGAAPSIEGVSVVAGRIVGLDGAGGLETLTVQPDGGGTPFRLTAQGVFVQTGRRPALSFAPEGLAQDAEGRVVVDTAMRTNLPGLFAIGDVSGGSDQTLAASMADGQKAVEAIVAASGGGGRT
jgi:thioredoxin reductase (NADPH)